MKDLKYFPGAPKNVITMTGNGTQPITTIPQMFGGDFKNIAITLIGSNTAAFTVKVMGSLQQAPVNFANASTATNSWQYIQTINMNSGNAVAGSTGYTFAGNGTLQVAVNTDVLTWIAIEVSGYATGTLEWFITYTNNV